MNSKKRRVIASVCAFLLMSWCLIAPAYSEANDLPVWSIPFAASLCRQEALTTQAIATSMYVHGLADYKMETARDAPGLLEVAISFTSGARLAVASRPAGGGGRRLRLVYQPARGEAEPGFFLQLTADCHADFGRLVDWDPEGRPVRLRHLDGNLEVSETEELNPLVPPGEDPGGIAVAHVDSGVNYLLPDFAARLARDASGVILGYDFRDDDARPADLDPSRPVFFPIRHGTSVASVLLREAPQVRLIPIRHPGNQFALFGKVVEHVAMGPARIVLMPLGGYREEDWTVFVEAARAHPELLFILSAGNDGRDLDAKPVFPAASGLDNAIVVTSSDAFGRIAPGSNWGKETVHIAVPGERLEVIDHRGAKGRGSGTSYAAPRVAALAARLLALNPDWTAAELRKAILDLGSPLPRARQPLTKYGWIANPALEGQAQ